MKKFFDSLSPEAIFVIAVILGALIVGATGAATMWRVHHNEMLPQERRQFIDL